MASDYSPTSLEFTMEPANNIRLANLCGQFDEHLRLIEQRLGVEINNRGGHFQIVGERQAVEITGDVLSELYKETESGVLSNREIHLYLQESANNAAVDLKRHEIEQIIIKTHKSLVKSRGPNQTQYLKNIQKYDLSFGVGPAGTGKTYLAVVCAVDALEKEQVRRIVLTRPAVEAGERLGFLPGDLAQKIDPYLRPLYDALYEMLGFEKVSKLIERNVIEIAPLAYMRGRTLNESYIILDEAQNTTIEQMKMFLTRIGFGSKVVITGDITQIDLPGSTTSGLRQVIKVLDGIDDISFTFFTAKDVVRHPLVRQIVKAYDKFESEN